MSLIKQAKDKFFELTDDFNVTPKQVTVNGKRVIRSMFPDYLKSFWKERVTDDDFILSNIKELEAEAKEIAESIIDEVSRPTYEAADWYSADNQLVKLLLESGKPVIDAVHGTYHVVDKTNRSIIPVAYEAFKALFTPKDFKTLFPKIESYKVVYSVQELPKRGDIIKPGLGLVELPQANLYIPPRWTFLEDKHEDLHEDHKKMIWTRFKDEESIERYFCVLYHMLTDRNRNICGLVHHREGTGKSTVMGKLPGHLVGMENTSYTDHNFMASPHKDAMLNKRMVFLDEHRLTKGQSSIEKKFVEDMLYINPKGKAAMTIPNTISFFMTSNNEGDIYTEPSNRRHYFLEDSGKHIIEEFGLEWVKEYNKRLHDDEFVANLGYYVLNNFKDYKYAPDAVYRGRSFERIVRATCFPGYEAIVEEILSGEVVDGILYSDAKTQYNKENRMNNKGAYFPRVQSFVDFFKDFQWEGEKICRIEMQDDGDVLLVPRG